MRTTVIALSMLLAPSVWSANTDLFSLSLEELTNLKVTAQKRTERLQDVPLSIALMPRDNVLGANLLRVEDISHLDVSAVFDKRISFNKSSLKIRGVGTLVFGAGVEPSVATFVDGVVMSRGGAGLDDLPDLERVELLRGPQSVLFGKNASAGAIHIITRAPNRDESEHSLGIRLTDDDEYRLNFDSSGPLSSELAYRFSAYNREYQGNVENVYSGNTLNGENTWGVRGKLLWGITDDLDVLFQVDYAVQDTSNGVRVLRSSSDFVLTDPAAAGVQGTPGTAGQITGITGSQDNNKVNLDREPHNDSESAGVGVEINWQWQGYNLTSISSVRSWKQRNDRDNDQTQLPFSLGQQENRDVDWYSQELRIASPLEGKVDYLAGVYYYYADNLDRSGDDRTLSNSPYLVDYNLAENRIENTNAAIFGQLNVHPNKKLTLFSGLRFLKDDVDVELSRVANTHNNSYVDNGALLSSRDVDNLKNSASHTKLIGKAGVQYQLADSVSGYVSFSRGFKGAAFNTSFKFDSHLFLTEEPVDPEQSDSYELGLRSFLWDQRLQLNATLHYTSFDGLHLTVRDLENNRNVLGSIPRVISKGVEIDFLAWLSDSVSIQGGFGYLDARYEDFTNANCYSRQTVEQGCQILAGGNVQDLSGHRLAQAPEWKMIFGGKYLFGVDQYLQVNWRAQSDTYLDAAGSPEAIQAGYGVVDVSIGAVSKRYSGRLFVENLFDKQYVSGTTINGNAGGDLIMHVLPRDFERHFGAELKFHF